MANLKCQELEIGLEFIYFSFAERCNITWANTTHMDTTMQLVGTGEDTLYSITSFIKGSLNHFLSFLRSSL